MKDNEKYLIPKGTTPSDDTGLGTYVTGFRKVLFQKSKWGLPVFILSLIALFFMYRHVINSNDVQPVFVVLMVFVTLVFMAAGLSLLINRDIRKEAKRPFDYIFVYTNGFVWEKKRFPVVNFGKPMGYGEVVESTKICFDKVGSIVLFNVRHAPTRLEAESGSDGNITTTFKVLDKDEKVIFLRENVHSYDHADLLAFEAIEKSWNGLARNRAMAELAQTGCIKFGNITLGRDLFTVDGNDYLNGVYRYVINNNLLLLYPLEPERSPYYDKLRNPSGAYAVSISEMLNKELFIELFEEFFRGRFGA
ncbi:MAG: hypothetical protein J6X58_00965 [Bacteroidales bacterium]|nr:hypothetical protein [Bacteroidales bacterium]